MAPWGEPNKQRGGGGSAIMYRTALRCLGVRPHVTNDEPAQEEQQEEDGQERAVHRPWAPVALWLPHEAGEEIRKTFDTAWPTCINHSVDTMKGRGTRKMQHKKISAKTEQKGGKASANCAICGSR